LWKANARVPLVVFMDVNLPAATTHAPGWLEEWRADVESLPREESRKYALAIASSNPCHYHPNDTLVRAHFVFSVPPEPDFPLPHELMTILGSATNAYGNIPSEYPLDFVVPRFF
jgi:hypothetical protein